MKVFKLLPFLLTLILISQTSFVFGAEAVLGPVPNVPAVRTNEISVTPPLLDTTCEDCIKAHYSTGKVEELVNYHTSQIWGSTADSDEESID